MIEDPEYQALSQLLPFYVNGTLGAEECAQIDAALAASPALCEELAVLGRLAQGVKTGGRELAQGDNQRADRVAAALAQVEAPRAPVKAKLAAMAAPGEGLASLLSFLHPKRWHPAVALTLAIAAIAQAGIIANLSGENAQGSSKIASLEKRLDEVEFQLASGPGGGEVKTGSIIVQLRAGTSWADFEALLADEGLTIIDGPSDGALTLSSAAKDAALSAQILRLRASPLVAAADKAV